MAHLKPAATSAAAICIYLTGSAAHADITAQQVWNDWKESMTGFGYVIEADESQTGDTLTIDNLSMKMAMPEDEGSMEMSMGAFSFRDNGDGTVSMSIAPEFPLQLSIDPAEGEAVDARIDYNSVGYSVVISGDEDDMTYTYSVADLQVALAELIVEGEPRDLGTLSMSIADITGLSNIKKSDLRSTTQRFASGPLVIDVDVTEPETGNRIQLNGSYDSFGFEGGGSVPPVMDADDMAEMLKAGFGFDGALSFGKGSATFNFQDKAQTVQGSTSSGGGTLKIAMDGERLLYEGNSTDHSIMLSGGDLPFPVELSMQEAGFNLLMPMSSNDDDQDFAFGLTMGNFSMSDMIWGIFDPGGQLPRDPATFTLDVTGKVKLLDDLLDAESLAAMDQGESAPGELSALDLNAFEISAAGAALTGTGSFTFDNSDTETFDGMPAPTGSIDLRLVGANGLMDTLVAMGLLPEDQAMGARMMMGMFAIPGDGEDTLTSKIEVSGDGQVKANGQRLR